MSKLRPPEDGLRAVLHHSRASQPLGADQDVLVGLAAAVPPAVGDFNGTNDPTRGDLPRFAAKSTPVSWRALRLQARVEVNPITYAGRYRAVLLSLRSSEDLLAPRLPDADCPSYRHGGSSVDSSGDTLVKTSTVLEASHPRRGIARRLCNRGQLFALTGRRVDSATHRQEGLRRLIGVTVHERSNRGRAA